MKRTGAALLAVLLIATVFAVFPHRAEAVSGSGWDLTGGVLTVTSQSVMGNSSSAAADYPWNAYRTQITEAIVAEGITSVGKLAFDSCTNMTKITFGSTVKTFYMDSLARNSALKTVFFGGPVTSIGQGTVYLSNNIETVTITDQTFEEFKAIATKTAYNFESYGGIRTGFDNARFIERRSFSWSISNGTLTVSGAGATVGEGNSGASDYPWYPRKSEVLKIEVAEGVACLGAHVFDGMENLKEIRVGKTVRSVGDFAFANGPLLRRVYFAGTVEDYGASIVSGSDGIASVVLADQSVSAFVSAASRSPYNFEINGGIVTGFDNAEITELHFEGFWKDYPDLTAFGEELKRKDINKNGAVTISDVTELLDYLSSQARWVDNSVYNIDLKGNYATITDVTVLLDALSGDCAHVFEATGAVEATCTEDGHRAYFRCALCGEEITDPALIPATGHTAVTDAAVPATCGTDGLTEGSHCSVCGETLTAQQVLPATGNHAFVTDEGLAPTCGKDGYTAGRYCTVCGYAAEGHEILPATGEHTPVADEAFAASCLRSGLTAGSHCAVCGDILVSQTVVPAPGHQYENGRCARCGGADPSILSGKSVLFTGDSICMASTYDKDHQWWGWAGRINRDYGLSRYTNAGVDGASVSNCRNTNTIIRQINNNKNTVYDYVLLEGGTNDGWDSVSPGAMTAGSAASAAPSNFDLSTFAGGLENLFYYTKLYYPNAKIGYIFTHRMTMNIGSLRDMSAYLAVAKQICEKWEIPMLNVDESPDFATKYFASQSSLVADGCHPTSAGYDLLYPAIARFMAEITLDNSFAIYEAKIETVSDGPAPYTPLPEKETDPQGWIAWLLRDMGQTTPLLEGGYAFSVRYNADGQSHEASPWEFWGGHFQFDYVITPDILDMRTGAGTASYPYVWEIWYKDSDAAEDYRHIVTSPWSVYTSGIYRLDTYDQGMTDMHLDPGSTVNAYDIVIIIYDRTTGEMVGWKPDRINYTDSTELFMADALAAGAIGG